MHKLYKKGVVISERDSAWAGMEMIKSGGNAIDAAVAAAIAESATAPADNGFGGYGGAMVIYLAKEKKVIVIDYNTRTPAGIKIDAIKKLGAKCGNRWSKATTEAQMAHGLNGWDFIGLPGTVAGLADALNKFGSKSWKEVFVPALQLIEGGIPVNETLHSAIKNSESEIRNNKSWSNKLLLGGRVPEIGELLPMDNFRKTLKILSKKGPKSFYEGEIGKSIIKDISDNGGVMSMEDLRRYKTLELKPISTTFMGHEIYTAPPCLGGMSVLEFLNIFEAIELRKKINTPKAMLEIYRKIWDDRLSMMGDPDFNMDFSFLFSKAYASKCADSLNENQATALFKDPSPGTIHISTADERGNMVALTQTKGGGFPGKINFAAESGIILNIGLGLFDPRERMPNCMEPWKRPLVNMCPTIVLRNGKPAFTLGAPGARYIVSVVSQMLLNILYVGMDIDASINAPRMHFENGEKVFLEASMEKNIKNQVIDMGYSVEEILAIGGPAHIISISESGMRGATDFRYGGGSIECL